ncbi:hypothetical protein PENSPDRAFT_752237 [Peniophora sp. CONT]|nr:hypothetical protein PENSPDRAFT_752237 [Peniophora sp. CONT]
MAPLFTKTGLLYLNDLRVNTFTTLLLTALYCILACVFCVAVYDLLKGGLRSRTNKLNFGAICVMFILTTSYTVASIVELGTGFYNTLTAEDFDFPVFEVDIGDSGPVALLQNLSFSVSVVLGDAIILWRALVIWSWKKSFKYISGFLLLSTTFVWTLEVVLGALREPEADNALRPSFVAVPGSLVTSLWATGLISWKYWQERRKLSKEIIRVSRRSALENVIAILTESGVVFTILWAVYLASALVGGDGVFNTEMTNVMVIAAVRVGYVIIHLGTPLHDQLTSIESRTVDVQDTESQDFLVEAGYAREGEIALYDLKKEDLR